MTLIGSIDLGGTKIYAAVLTPEGEIRGEARLPTAPRRPPEAIADSLVQAIEQAATAANTRPSALPAVGLSAPGPVDTAAGVIVEAPNLPTLNGFPLVRRLSDRLGASVLIENDANCAAYAEYRVGAGGGGRGLVYITISTGIGGGIVLDGRLYRGVNGVAGEVGHIPLQPRGGPRCGCGSRGCLEALASGTAIARRARAALARGGAPGLRALRPPGQPVDAEMVARAARAGDPDCRRIYRGAGWWLGQGFVTVLHLFNPDRIVVGGGVSLEGDLVLGPARAVVAERAFASAERACTITTAALGTASPAIGAALLAFEART